MTSKDKSVDSVLDPTSGGPRTRVLLVEDNPADADLALEVIESEPGLSAEVTLVERLGDALSSLEAEAADVVLLDLGLPDAAGKDGVRALVERHPSLPVVVLTGSGADEALAVECLRLGAQDYLPKSELNGPSLRRSLGFAIARGHERRQRQRAEELDRFVGAIVEASADAIVSVRPSGEVLSWNSAAETTFGAIAAEAIGRPVAELLDAPGSEAWTFERLVERAVAGSLLAPRDVVWTRADGVQLELSVSVSAIRDPSGAVSAVSAMCRDISARRAHEAQMRRTLAALAVRSEKVRTLLRRIDRVREDERARLAREVDDELGQLLEGVSTEVQALGEQVRTGAAPGLLLSHLQELQSLTDGAQIVVRRISSDLRPTILDREGLAPAVRDEVRRFEMRTGIRTQVKVVGWSAPPPDAATAMFRILQELLANVGRHAKATLVRVTLRLDEGEDALLVEDDGVGVPTEAERRPGTFGLVEVRERAEGLGGIFRFGSGDDGGARAEIQLPRPSPAPEAVESDSEGH